MDADKVIQDLIRRFTVPLLEFKQATNHCLA